MENRKSKGMARRGVVATTGAACAIFLSGVFYLARAQDYSSSTRSLSGTASAVFIGAYGETVDYHPPDRVEARMRGPVEVIDGVSWWVRDAETDAVIHPQQTPTAKDFIPENFQRMGLVQLLIIPKEAPESFQSLSAIRKAKVWELERAGAEFSIEPAEFAEPHGRSFSIVVANPYQLKQTYVESKDHFFILTSGPIEPPLVAAFRTSLARLLRPAGPGAVGDSTAEWAELRDVSLVGWGGWSLVMLSAGFLAGLAQISRHRFVLRFSIIGRSVIIAVNVFIICGIAVQGLLRAAGFLPAGGASALVLGLAAPWLFPSLASWLGGRYESRALRYLLFVVALLGFMGETLARLHHGTRLSPAVDMGQAFWVAEIFGILCGVCFGAAYQPRESEESGAA
jgi:hypothetical protein